MPAPISRYRPSRQWGWAGLAALMIAAFSGWVALRWPFAWISAGMAAGSALLAFALAFQPVIEIFDSGLKVGRRSIPWPQIRRVDRISVAPLMVRLTFGDRKRVVLVYAGDSGSSDSLLRQVRRNSREALIDGLPYRQFWGEAAPASGDRKQPQRRYPLLRPEDEDEVEWLFQRLKAVGHIEPKRSDEK